jgi:3D (Asp-Asp-Asp) domain-containing protein
MSTEAPPDRGPGSRYRVGRALACILLASSCAGQPVRSALPPRAPTPPPSATREIQVTATAFNSVADQTDAQPRLTASGDRLRPGMRVIAVSRDLERAGLTFGKRVEIEGMDGEWVVLDRMAPRWQRKIDVYMGNDIAAARRFGERTVRIRWTPD